MSTNKRFLATALLGTLLTAITGYTYGRLSQRWGPSIDLLAAGDHLQTLPGQIGDWQVLDELTMSDKVVEMLECAGYTTRVYQNQKTGDTTTISLIVGPSGPIAVHTPEICYSSRAHTLEERATEVAIGNKEESPSQKEKAEENVEEKAQSKAPQTLWRTTFRSNDIMADHLCVYYGWSLGTTWYASKHPRFEYGGKPLLYKLQIAGPLVDDGSGESRDPSLDFLQALFSSNWNLSP
jgi:hypothetical protein